jgi:TolB-like protein/Tfp pilus assembly protein PilF
MGEESPNNAVATPTGAVFLSYASQDAEPARKICDALRAAGIEVWFDQSELRGGDAWDSSIRKQIKTCALFLPVISASTSARAEGYFRLEWKLAVDRSHLMAAERPFILPVVIDGVREADAIVPDGFRDVQWTSCPAGQMTPEFVARIAGLLSPDAPRAPSTIVRPSAKPATAPARGRPRRRHALLIGVGTAVLIAVGVLLAYQMALRSKAISMVAVLPFENGTGDPANDYLGNGISESLINKLSSLNGLQVISRTSAFALKGKTIDPIEIGKKLGVDALVLGNLTMHDSRLQISAELVSARDSTQLWGDHYERATDDVQQLEGQLATTIAQTLRSRLSGVEKVRLAHIETTDPEAYRLYLKGRESLVGTDADMSKSIAFFQQAVAHAPNYATAYAGLAAVYSVEAFLGASGRAEAAGKARDAARRALELDPDLGEAHSALADILFLFEWDWPGADSEYRRGVALSPGSEAVHEAYGSYLNAMGRLDEGLAESREAARLDPLSVQPFHDMAINALVRGDFEKAAAGFRHTIEIDPQWTWGYIKLARTLALAKECKEAYVQTEIAERRIAGGVGALSRSWLGSTYATCGDVTRAREKLGELHAFEAKRYVDPETFADIHASLGEVDEAVRWYRKAFEDRSPDMVFAQVGSRLNPRLASDAGFRAILDQMAFPTSAK